MLRQPGITADDHTITLIGFMGSRAIDRNHTASRLCLDSISGKTLTIIQVVDMDLLYS
jgi:hypothetical protein